MRGYIALCVASFALAGTGANAASSDVETARKEAAAARARVNDVRSQQMALRSELNQVAAQIEALKARKRGALLKGGELDASLRRSQEISDRLTEVARELASAEADLQSDNLALSDVLSRELESLRARWDQTRDRTARGELLARMRALRAERAQVYAMLPSGVTPILDVRGSDDPEDLLQQADALRDAEDKLRQQIKALEGRIVEVRREREMERRMRDFLGEEALFEEQDRRLRRSTSSGSFFENSRVSAGAPQAPGPATPVSPTSADSASPGAATGSTATPGTTISTPPPPPATAPAQTAASEFSTQRSDGRTLLGTGALVEERDLRELPALEARLKQLQSLAKQIDQRADAIEARARDAR